MSHTEVQNYIDKNLKTDLPTLVLKGSPFPGVSIQEIANQILSKSKCQNKLPTWFEAQGIYYPNPVNIEQTSSEVTAQYKSALISGKSLIDLTGGFGVDSYFFSKKIDQVTHCEINSELSEIVKHNFKALGVKNIHCKNEDGIDLIRNSTLDYDWIYVDPSRRNDLKGKVFRLEDCLPDVTIELNHLLRCTRHIMIKLSPLMDISLTVNSLQYVNEVQVIAVKNEVKELLVLVEKNYKGTCNIKAVNIINGKKDCFEGKFQSQIEPTYSLPKKYLYEPNSAILKSGLFNEVSSQLKVDKLHVNSHLYTSEDFKEFPGRRFAIISVIPYNKKLIKQKFGSDKANITTRNFYETVAQIRKKTGIKEGGSDFLFFTTNIEDRAVVIHCKKV